jgi:hypothetical protein
MATLLSGSDVCVADRTPSLLLEAGAITALLQCMAVSTPSVRYAGALALHACSLTAAGARAIASNTLLSNVVPHLLSSDSLLLAASAEICAHCAGDPGMLGPEVHLVRGHAHVCAVRIRLPGDAAQRGAQGGIQPAQLDQSGPAGTRDCLHQPGLQFGYVFFLFFLRCALL